MLNDRLPDDATSYKAIFEDCGPVTLEKSNPYGLTGFTPSKLSLMFIVMLSFPAACNGVKIKFIVFLLLMLLAFLTTCQT